MQPTEPNLTDAERAELDGANAQAVERWIQTQGNNLDSVMAATRNRMRQAHRILDRKLDEEHRALVAGRPSDFPKTQSVGGAN